MKLTEGFLGTRADFMSDLLILALALIIPALVTGIILARTRKLKAHRALMLSIYFGLVGYVALYEGNMIRMGGMDFLRERLRMPEGIYFLATGTHIAIGLTALIMGALVIRKGSKLYPDAVAKVEQGAGSSGHFTMGWAGLGFLALSVITGLGIYYLTFVYVA